MPRAKGQSTRVIITEYDLARPTTEPHDIVVKDGAVWYTDFGEPFITKFEPKTMKITEYPLPDKAATEKRPPAARTRPISGPCSPRSRYDLIRALS